MVWRRLGAGMNERWALKLLFPSGALQIDAESGPPDRELAQAQQAACVGYAFVARENADLGGPPGAEDLHLTAVGNIAIQLGKKKRRRNHPAPFCESD